MSAALDFIHIEKLAPRIGVHDVPCPLCSAHHSPRGARRSVLRIWRTDQHFAGFACARCGNHGWSRDGRRRASRLSPDRLAEIRRDAAEREAAEIAARQRTASFLWSRRHPITHTPAEIYLREARGYRGDIPLTLGYLPARNAHPHAMIAAFGVAAEIEPGLLVIGDDAVRGIHLTKLNAEGTAKAVTAPNKIMIGRSAGFPICIAAPNDLLGMAVTEGIEDALSLHQATGLGAWAAGAAGRMPALTDRVPGYIECVTICADADRAGRDGAIWSCRQAYRTRDRRHIAGIFIMKMDANDLLRERGEDALRAEFDAAAARPRTDLSGNALLVELHEFLGRFVAYPTDHEQVAHALWIVHTHLMDAWESTPRIAFLSPEPGSGKTRALEVSELLVPSPVEAVNVTPAYLFRKVGSDQGRPTVLYDEIDTVFGPKAKDNEEIRGLLNAGHRRGAVAGRCVVKGKTVETEEISAYCAVALAGLGGLPDTILSRAVVIRMRRRAPDETVEPYRRRVHERAGKALRERVARWASLILKQVTDVWPVMPEGIKDRDADVWEPLLAIADAAGGDWPERARAAAVALVALAKESTPSLGIKLLADIRQVFGDAEAMATESVLKALHAIDESPWADIKGKPLNDRGLAVRLRPYGVRSKSIRMGDHVPRGYTREDFNDAWLRYLGQPARESATSATSATNGRWKAAV